MTSSEMKSCRVRLNGRECTIESGLSVADLLGDLNLAPEHVVVEVNGAIVPPEQQNECVIPDGAEVEIIRFVGGG